MYDVIVVGAGPAGLTSALYLKRANKNVLVLEAKCYGGQIINASKIENYPGIMSISGVDFATNLYNQVKSLGVEIKYETVLSVLEDKTVVTNKGKYKAKSVILAIGQTPRKLNLDREQEFIGKGLSYCATCDGYFYKDKVVVVNGGGNTALMDALYLSSIASKVYVVHRREEFRGFPIYLEELKKKKNVIFILNRTITNLNGNESLESITVKDNKGQEQVIKTDALFVAIGEVPNNVRFKNIVSLTKDGYIKTKDEVKTKTKGIFVAGDAREKDLRQLTTAVSDGALCASKAIEELK